MLEKMVAQNATIQRNISPVKMPGKP